METHVPHPQIERRKQHGVHTTDRERVGFNGWLAVTITNLVGTMWCAYAFTILALISLPDAIKAGTAALVAWIAQTFLQLVLLSIIMVGQKVAAAASDKQALQTYKDAEALLEISDDMHKLLATNTTLTEEIHKVLNAKPAAS
jgi:ABC-type nickel/cobalt efflux system permease component RcnA